VGSSCKKLVSLAKGYLRVKGGDPEAGEAHLCIRKSGSWASAEQQEYPVKCL